MFAAECVFVKEEIIRKLTGVYDNLLSSLQLY